MRLNKDLQCAVQISNEGSQATNVIVWLGVAEETSDVAMNYVASMSTHIERSRPKKIWSANRGRAILALCQRTYWRRIWIVQEIMLAQDVVVLCGQRSFNLSCLNNLFERLNEILADGRIEHHPHANAILDSDASRITQQKYAWRSLQSESRLGFSLKHLLETYHDMECTDIRDKVYSLLGLVHTKDPMAMSMTVQADYSKSTAELYMEVLHSVFADQEIHSVKDRMQFIGLLRGALKLSPSDVKLISETAKFLPTTEFQAYRPLKNKSNKTKDFDEIRAQNGQPQPRTIPETIIQETMNRTLNDALRDI